MNTACGAFTFSRQHAFLLRGAVGERFIFFDESVRRKQGRLNFWTGIHSHQHGKTAAT